MLPQKGRKKGRTGKGIGVSLIRLGVATKKGEKKFAACFPKDTRDPTLGRPRGKKKGGGGRMP